MTSAPTRNAEDRQEDCADLVKAVRSLVEALGGIELELPPRAPMREPPDFSA